MKTQLPQLTLADSNSNYRLLLSEISKNKGLLLVFISNDCLFVRHALPEFRMIANDYRAQGLGVAAVYSPEQVLERNETLQQMERFAFTKRIDFPYLLDEGAYLARILNAEATPECFLFDARGELFYRGRFDASEPGNGIPQSGNDLRNAIDSLIYNRKPPYSELPGAGTPIFK